MFGNNTVFVNFVVKENENMKAFPTMKNQY